MVRSLRTGKFKKSSNVATNSRQNASYWRGAMRLKKCHKNSFLEFTGLTTQAGAVVSCIHPNVSTHPPSHKLWRASGPPTSSVVQVNLGIWALSPSQFPANRVRTATVSGYVAVFVPKLNGMVNKCRFFLIKTPQCK